MPARRFPPPWSIGESVKLRRLGLFRTSRNWGKTWTHKHIIWLIVGAIAGWLAGMVVKGGGYGLIGDIVVGIVGALIAGWLLPQIGIVIGGGIIAAITPSSARSSC
jgi:uncharacterized membrane protein YeaQ/YmgE (transglycosylase-associated protein family)